MFASLHILISIFIWLISTSGKNIGQRITTEAFDYEERFITWTESQLSTPSLEKDDSDFDFNNMPMPNSSSWSQHLVIEEKKAKIIDDNLVFILAKAFAMNMQIQVMTH